jgi:hypothetical protein
MSGTPDSRFQRQKAIAAFLRKFNPIEIFRLEAKRRYRSSKLVCRIRNEPALLRTPGPASENLQGTKPRDARSLRVPRAQLWGFKGRACRIGGGATKEGSTGWV